MNLDTLSADSQRFMEVIPFPDSLGEEAVLIEIFTSKGYLKGQGVLISATPSLWNKVIMCMYLLIFRMLDTSGASSYYKDQMDCDCVHFIPEQVTKMLDAGT